VRKPLIERLPRRKKQIALPIDSFLRHRVALTVVRLLTRRAACVEAAAMSDPPGARGYRSVPIG
jgi:hypothetical protein